MKRRRSSSPPPPEKRMRFVSRSDHSGGGGNQIGRSAAWLEIQVLDEDGAPIADLRYEVRTLDDRTVKRGALDQNGAAHVWLDDKNQLIAEGTYQLLLLDLDEGELAAERVEEARTTFFDGRRDWLEVLLVAEDGAPIAKEPYEVFRLGEQEPFERAVTTRHGLASVLPIDPGEYVIVFPRLDEHELLKVE